MQLDFSKTALLIVDIQNDFCPAYTGKDGKEHPAGALSVTHGDDVLVPVNRLSALFKKNGAQVLATQDWHPANHVSFASSHKNRKIGDIILIDIPDEAIASFAEKYPELHDPIPAAVQQVLWPVHCVQRTHGAEFHDGLVTDNIDYVIRKGFHKNIDSYSAFFENDRCTPTDLHAYLKPFPIDTLVIAGLATDYCVFYSALDAVRLGYKVIVVNDACEGIDEPEGSIENAVKMMKNSGVTFAESKEIEG